MQQWIVRISWDKSTAHRLKQLCHISFPLAAQSNERPWRGSAKSTWAAVRREVWQILAHCPTCTTSPLYLHPPPAPRTNPVQHHKENTVFTLRLQRLHTPSVSHLARHHCLFPQQEQGSVTGAGRLWQLHPHPWHHCTRLMEQLAFWTRQPQTAKTSEPEEVRESAEDQIQVW